MNIMKSKVEERFCKFFDKWVFQLDEFLQEMKRVSSSSVDPAAVQVLVSRITQHYKEYYSIKWALAHEDVLAFFCPVWVTPLENAFSWITGWKPSVVFKLVDSSRGLSGSSLTELTQDQVRKIEELRVKIRIEEEKVEREMERQQVGVADRKMAELARLVVRVKNGEQVSLQVEGLLQVALKGVMGGLEKVMKAADCVRLRTLKGLLDVFNPSQCVDFLGGIGMLQVQFIQSGKGIRDHGIATTN